MTLLWFIAFVGGSGLAELAYWQWRRTNQRRLDMSLVTYEVTWPRDLKEDAATRVFEALSGLYKPLGHYGSFGRPTIVCELLREPNALHHLISFPKHLTATVQSHLRGAVPGMGFEEVVTYPVDWNYVVELKRPGRVVQKKGGTYEWEEAVADPNLISVLLGSMAECHEGERIIAQFVMTPTGNLGDTTTPYMAIGRIAAHGHDIRAKELIERVLSAYRDLGVFRARALPRQWRNKVNERSAPLTSWPIAISCQALAVCWAAPIDNASGPGLSLGHGRKLVPEAMVPSTGFIIGTSNYPGSMRPVAIAPESIDHHVWALGPTGRGKSTLLHVLAAQIMEQGHGLILVEPKGALAEDVLRSVPRHRIDDVVWFDPFNTARPIGLNVLAGSDPEQAAGHIVGLFKGLYGDSWGARLEWILKYSVLTAALNGLTLVDVMQLLVDKDFRGAELRRIKSPIIKQFWRDFEDGPDNAKQSVVNKLDAFTGYGAIRNIVGQTGGLDMDEVVRQNRILLVPLRPNLGDANVSMLGSLIVWRVWQAIRTRPEVKPTVLMLDEWQRFTDMSVSMEDALAQARGFGMPLVLANQTTSQLSPPPSLLSATRGNVGTQIVFGLRDEDARKMSADLAPMTPDDLQGLGQYEVAVRMMTPTGQAPVTTVKVSQPPLPTGAGSRAKHQSELKYGVDRIEVEKAIAERHASGRVERPKPSIGREVEVDA